MTTFDGLKDLITKDYGLPPERLTPDTPLEDIDIDSLAVTELMFSLEDKFNVTAGEKPEGLNTLGDIARYIDRLIAERDGGGAAAPDGEMRE